MWPRILSTVGLSMALGTHFFIVGVSSLVSSHSTPPLSVAPMKQACRFGYGLVPKNRRLIPRSPLTAVASYGPPLDDFQPVPKDETFRPMGFLREVIAAPVPPADCDRFDGIGKETGGVWHSRVMGLLPSTVFASPTVDAWIIEQEATDNITPYYPESVAQLIGSSLRQSVDVPIKKHAAMMKIYDQTLSPKSTVAMIPIMEEVLRKRVIQWEQCAASGQEVKLFEDIQAFTLETIARAMLYDYATDNIISDILRIAPVQFAGAFSVPRRFPWPLNQLPLFSFGRSMNARQEFVGIMRGVLDERRNEVKSTTPSGGSEKQWRNAGVLGALVDIQAKQRDDGGPGKGEVEIDDDYIITSVFGMFLAGWKTSSSAISRMVQLLGSAEGKVISEQLIEELIREIPESDQETLEQTPTAMPSPGILSRLPITEATFLEAIRLHPSIPAVFRKVKKETSYNGYRINAGERIQWNTSHGWRSESLYPDAARFCPFRYLKRGSDGGYTLARGKNAEQPLPRAFGFGLRQCRGRELAKLEAFLFLRALLTNFDFELVEGQVKSESSGEKADLRLLPGSYECQPGAANVQGLWGALRKLKTWTGRMLVYTPSSQLSA